MVTRTQNYSSSCSVRSLEGHRLKTPMPLPTGRGKPTNGRSRIKNSPRKLGLFLLDHAFYFSVSARSECTESSLVFLDKAGHELFYVFWVVDILKVKPAFLSSGLYVHLSIRKDGLQNAANLRRRILNCCEIELRGGAIEESFLFNVDDPFVGDDPGIEVVIREFEKGE